MILSYFIITYNQAKTKENPTFNLLRSNQEVPEVIETIRNHAIRDLSAQFTDRFLELMIQY